MRIVLLAGASSIHTIRWANGLVQAGLDVHLITQHAPKDPLDENVRLTVFPHRGILGYFLMVPAVRRFLRDIRPDVVNAHYASGYATTARLAGYHPWMLSVWGSDVYDVPYRTPLHGWWVRKNLEAADLVASTSHCMADQTRCIAPSLTEIPITPFGVDIETFSSASVPDREGISEAPLIIGTIKKLAPIYGVDTLIEAYAKLRTKFEVTHPSILSRLQLRIVGDGPDRGTLENLAEQLGVRDNVTFVGRVPHNEVPSQLKELDIYVALSRQESFGVAVLEAGAAGLPVVVSDAGGLPEVVKQGETGLVVPKDNANEAADALEQLIEDSALRKTMGEKGLAHVSNEYSWKDSIQTMITTLKKAGRKTDSSPSRNSEM